MTCKRDGCELPVNPRRTFCSHRCSSAHYGQQRQGSGFYARLQVLSMAAKRKAGKGDFLRPSEIGLMASGRYHEAARAMYERGYSAGWLAGKTGARQVPAKGIA